MKTVSVKNDLKLNFAIPSKIFDILTILNRFQFGGEAYLVGGCIRDLVMGREIHDYDITTKFTPEEIKSCFKDYVLINNNGEKHGTVTVRYKDENIEITTFRVDGEYSDHRKPDSVTFTRSLEEDLSRRDFTINALAYYGDTIFDYFDGIKDIKNKVVKCVGDAEKRFEEDALRILRAMRFASTLDFSIDADTLHAMKKKKYLLSYISKERIKVELDKMLVGKGFVRVALLCDDILGYIIPELGACRNFNQNNPCHYLDAYQHSVYVVGATKQNDSMTKLAALLHDIGKPRCYQDKYEDGVFIKRTFHGHPEKSRDMAVRILDELKYSNYEKDFILTLIEQHDYMFNDTIKCMKKFLAKIPESINKEDFIKSYISLRDADKQIHINLDYSKIVPGERLYELYKQIIDNPTENAFQLKNLEINGNDLIDLGYHGKQIGDLLALVLENVINGQLINDKDIILKFIKEREK